MDEFELLQTDEEVYNYFNGSLEYEEMGPSARARVDSMLQDLED